MNPPSPKSDIRDLPSIFKDKSGNIAIVEDKKGYKPQEALKLWKKISTVKGMKSYLKGASARRVYFKNEWDELLNPDTSPHKDELLDSVKRLKLHFIEDIGSDELYFSMVDGKIYELWSGEYTLSVWEENWGRYVHAKTGGLFGEAPPEKEEGNFWKNVRNIGRFVGMVPFVFTGIPYILWDKYRWEKEMERKHGKGASKNMKYTIPDWAMNFMTVEEDCQE